MKSILYRYGAISGALLVFFMFASALVWGNKLDYVMGTIIGYLTMILSFVPVYIGIKEVRNTVNTGFISFQEAFKSGLGIVLVSSVIFVIGWMIYYQMIGESFMESNHQEMLAEMERTNEPPENIEAQKQALDDLREKFSSPMRRIAYGLYEVIPPGIIIALFSSLILMRKK